MPLRLLEFLRRDTAITCLRSEKLPREASICSLSQTRRWDVSHHENGPLNFHRSHRPHASRCTLHPLLGILLVPFLGYLGSPPPQHVLFRFTDLFSRTPRMEGPVSTRRVQVGRIVSDMVDAETDAAADGNAVPSHRTRQWA